MDKKEFDCPQCGDQTETLHEGYCKQCCADNQAALDQHNFRRDYWNSLSDAGKDAEIEWASRSPS